MTLISSTFVRVWVFIRMQQGGSLVFTHAAAKSFPPPPAPTCSHLWITLINAILCESFKSNETQTERKDSERQMEGKGRGWHIMFDHYGINHSQTVQVEVSIVVQVWGSQRAIRGIWECVFTWEGFTNGWIFPDQPVSAVILLGLPSVLKHSLDGGDSGLCCRIHQGRWGNKGRTSVFYSEMFFFVQIIIFSAQPPEGWFVYSAFLQRPPHHHRQPSPQTHAGPMLIILSAIISLLIVASLFILQIRSSLERLRVAARVDQTGRLMNAYQMVWQ